LTHSNTTFGRSISSNQAGDLIISSDSAIYVYSLLPKAKHQVLGGGCGQVGRPVLESDHPVLGRRIAFSGSVVAPFKVGTLLHGPVAGSPIDLGGGCFWFIDPGLVIVLGPVLASDATGHWQSAVTIPSNHALAGLHIALQGVFFPTDTHLGLDLTNGLRWTIGYP
jgi:hypothetical protein